MSAIDHRFNPNGKFTQQNTFNGGLGDTRFSPITETDNQADAENVSRIIQETRDGLGESYQIEVARRAS
jgi:hypothetical protein